MALILGVQFCLKQCLIRWKMIVMNKSIISISQMNNKKQPSVPIADYYDKYLKQTIIHKRQIVESEIEGTKYQFTYVQKKGEWHFSDCLLILETTVKNQVTLATSRMTTGFPIVANCPPVFKRRISLEEIKDAKVNKDHELHVRISGNRQSVWVFRFYVEAMAQKWCDFILGLRFKNNLNQTKIQAPLEKAHLEASNVSREVEYSKVEKSVVNPENLKREQIVHKQQVKEAVGVAARQPEHIVEHEAHENHVLEHPVEGVRDVKEQEGMKAKIVELQKENAELKSKIELQTKTYQTKLLQMGRQLKLSQEKVVELSKHKQDLNVSLDSKQKQNAKKLQQANLGSKVLKDKYVQFLRSKQQFQTKLSKQQKEHQRQVATLTHQNQLLVQKNVQITRLKDELKVQLQTKQHENEKMYAQLAEENKICKEKVVEIHKSREALTGEMDVKQKEHERALLELNEHHQTVGEQLVEAERVRDGLSHQLELKVKEEEALNLELRGVNEKLLEMERVRDGLNVQLAAKVKQEEVYVLQVNENNRKIDQLLKAEELRKVQMLSLKNEHEKALAMVVAENAGLKQNLLEMQKVQEGAVAESERKKKERQVLIVALTAENKQLKEKVELIEKTKEDMKRSLRNKQEENEGIAQRLTEFKTENGSLKEAVRQKEERLNVQAAEAERKMKVLEVKVDTLTVCVAAKDKEILELKTEAVNFVSVGKERQEQIQLRDTEIVKMKSEHEAKIKEFEDKAAEMEKNTEELVAGTKAKSDQMISNLNNEVKELEQKNHQISINLRTKDFECEKLRLEIQSLQGKCKQLQSHGNFLQSRLQTTKANSLSQLLKLNNEEKHEAGPQVHANEAVKEKVEEVPTKEVVTSVSVENSQG